jgi:hypothetical protein
LLASGINLALEVVSSWLEQRISIFKSDPDGADNQTVGRCQKIQTGKIKLGLHQTM